MISVATAARQMTTDSWGADPRHPPPTVNGHPMSIQFGNRMSSRLDGDVWRQTSDIARAVRASSAPRAVTATCQPGHQ